MVESAELVIKYCLSFGCHAQLDSSPTWPLRNEWRKRPLIQGMERHVRSVFHVSNIHVTLDERRSTVIQAIQPCKRIDETYFSSPSRSKSFG